eukprot:CAMPEP_0174728382 /NCGR_PEP_ID=MMETSP1094-20130205/51638_1 /TAXON_ID=156173 /ORGANISM="Chrysochromulina brevifilum, Strain UTEX LB 985" /LENGTH=227 /DNA_ID=CAMNT_0015930283 /DNA_START=21 /DNA_END=705 /DNA_ORIENTATION=+
MQEGADAAGASGSDMREGDAPGSRLTDIVPPGLAPARRYTLLVIEDDTEQQFVLDELFSAVNAWIAAAPHTIEQPDCSYALTFAASATDALRILRGRAVVFDLIIADIELPDMHGTSLLPLLKAMVGEQTPIVVLTQHTQVALEMVCMRCAVAYLHKPLQWEQARSMFHYCKPLQRPDSYRASGVDATGGAFPTAQCGGSGDADTPGGMSRVRSVGNSDGLNICEPG